MVIKGGVIGFWLFMLAVMMLALTEFYQLLRQGGFFCYRVEGVVAGLLLAGGMLWLPPEYIFCLLTIIPIGILTYTLFTREYFTQKIMGAITTVWGIWYIVWLLGHLVWLRGLPRGRELVLFIVFVIWATDIGGFYAGKAFGKRRLAPQISPGKTIAGAVGGIVLALITAFIINLFFLPLPLGEILTMGLVISVLAQLGDLSESLIKRAMRVKDSGGIIPGHGGVLDRIDSLLFAAPIFYYYSRFFLIGTG